MKQKFLHALRFYLFVTAIMILNTSVLLGILWLTVNAISEASPTTDVLAPLGLVATSGDNSERERNFGILSTLPQSGVHPDLKAVLRYCGKPDGYAGSIGSDLHLVYYYDRFATKDWATYLSFSNGYLVSVAWNDASVNDSSLFRDWKEAETGAIGPGLQP